jgi:hypothetical protein
MDEITEKSAKMTRATPVIRIACSLASIEFLISLIYYVRFYQLGDLWDRLGRSGTAILAGLALCTVLSASAGYYFYRRADRDALISKWLRARNLDKFLSAALALGSIFILLIVLHVSFISATPLRVLYKHPALQVLALVLAATAFFSLLSFRVKLVDKVFQYIFAAAINLESNIRRIDFRRIDYGQLISRYKYHLGLWMVMVIYLIAAPFGYTRFYLVEGKPTPLTQTLPSTTDEIKFYIDVHAPIKYRGQELFQLVGWAFLLGDTGKIPYDRYIVLKSDSNTYFYAVNSIRRLDVERAYKDLNQYLSYSGYTTLISKDLLPKGNYHIGILFKDPSGPSTYYYDSMKLLERTPNNLIFIDGSAQ